MINQRNLHLPRRRKACLKKSPNEFVVRATPEKLQEHGITEAEKISPSSSRVTASEDQLGTMMDQARNVATTHHAYYEAETGKEFLITDRILVTFRDPLPAEKVDEFAGRYGLAEKETYSDRDYLFQLTTHTRMDAVKLVVELTENESLIDIQLTSGDDSIVIGRQIAQSVYRGIGR